MPPSTLIRNAIASDVADVGRSLADSFSSVISSIPGRPAGPQQVAKALGEDKGLISRLLKAIQSRDPIAVTHLIPGPEPLQRVLESSRKLGVSIELIRMADSSVDRFSELIRRVGKDRTTFDGVVSHMLPEARERFDGRVKQQLFRGQSQLKGFSVDVELAANFISPTPQSNCLEYASIAGVLGLRRLRPQSAVRFAARVVRGDESSWSMTTLEGQTLGSSEVGRLDRFCTAPLADVSLEEYGDAIYFCLGGSDFGPDSAVDLVLGHRVKLQAELYSQAGERRLSGVGVEVDKPAKVLLMDTFVHESVYAGSEPELLIFDTAFRGAANMNDPRRVPDRLQHEERLEFLGRGFNRASTSHVPNYVDMLHHVAETSRWKPDEFRTYRTLIPHPIYGTQITLGFERPPAPER